MDFSDCHLKTKHLRQWVDLLVSTRETWYSCTCTDGLKGQCFWCFWTLPTLLASLNQFSNLMKKATSSFAAWKSMISPFSYMCGTQGWMICRCLFASAPWLGHAHSGKSNWVATQSLSTQKCIHWTWAAPIIKRNGTKMACCPWQRIRFRVCNCWTLTNWRITSTLRAMVLGWIGSYIVQNESWSEPTVPWRQGFLMVLASA